MARRSVLSILGVALMASACVSVEGPAQPSIPDFSFVPPVIPPVVIPTLPPLPTATLQPIPTQQPTLDSEQTPVPGSLEPPTEPPGSGGTGASPPASPIDISALLTAPLGVVNLSDSTVSISLDIFDSGEDQGTIAERAIGPYGNLYENVLEAPYAATFTGVGSEPITCTFDAKSGQEIDFTVVDSDILVSRLGQAPQSADDLFVATSSLCQATGS